MAMDNGRPKPNPPPRRASRQSSTEDANAGKVAHTLNACYRCRQRKSRCDTGLPKCGPCERSSASCEYFDASKGRMMPRGYVVQLQERVRELEAQLAALDTDDTLEPDPEALVRDAAVVTFRETDESKYLGPSSGTTMTRIVMQLAKQVTSSKSIKEIISEERAKQVKDSTDQEPEKPTSKVYPLVSLYPATELPGRDLTFKLLDLFNLKVQTMYPVFHEPALVEDVSAVYNGTADAFQHFVVRMIIAIGLQRWETKWAGLGDSYYLAALEHLEKAISSMNMKTLQCFFLIGEYSLISPTRTAVFYAIGIAVRLIQQLGYHKEETLIQGAPNQLEIDLRRRIFWAIMSMDYALAHSLGRPCILATSQEAIDVQWFETLDDQYITSDGLLPGPFSTRKWIAIHFYQMRMLQLEIRRKIYQKKRPTPVDDSDPWFHQMEQKLQNWKDASPNNDEDSGFDKTWFEGRYNTMVVFLFRPSPQIPRPSARAAIRCYKACEWNIYMHRKQVETRSVETTWAFTQSIFMAINAILWALSYEEVRQMRTRDEVNGHLQVALEALDLASERWPGVASARHLYEALISAILRIYDRDGDIPVSANSPFYASEPQSPPASQVDGSANSRTTSPFFQSPEVPTINYPTPPSQQKAANGQVPYHSSPQGRNRQITQTGSYPPAGLVSGMGPAGASVDSLPSLQWGGSPESNYIPESQYNNPLPTTFPELANWTPPTAWDQMNNPQQDLMFPLINPLIQDAALFPNSSPNMNADPLFSPYWPQELDEKYGLSEEDQNKLMKALDSDGLQNLNMLIDQTQAFYNPGGRQGGG